MWLISFFQDEEVFEIVDFTSASEWETFTSKLEEILLAWQLSGKDKEESAYQRVPLDGRAWKSSTENISFACKSSVPLRQLQFHQTSFCFRLPIHCYPPLDGA